ncbi:type III secretion system (T3SS) SseB-like protein [Murinocardiopsis flavida]|uniref:Type III secretion system (T3SS) SseB-like protein n=1 Tax=Murinocardiopsis flavida TaxID=645275 RepID=A0A2P8DHY3_9ACTN|nr:SseB family protein [Murinocardiopsis flavida]PSK96827.1 type III secretion system (T3SS) SseB-like protein [Murinocardiopsis flavida]
MTGRQIIGAQGFRDDDGGADPAVRAALDSFSAGGTGERQVLSAIGSSRLLIPVAAVATEVEEGADGLRREKHSEVGMPVMTGKDGRRGVLAFTSVDTVKLWRADARPVPYTAVDACRAAVDDGAEALVVDVAGPVTYPIQGRFLTSLAQHGAIPEPKEDPQVLAMIYRITHTEAGIERVRIHDSQQADIGVRLEMETRDDASIRRVAERLAADLAHVLPGGVELSAVVRARRG